MTSITFLFIALFAVFVAALIVHLASTFYTYPYISLESLYLLLRSTCFRHVTESHTHIPHLDGVLCSNNSAGLLSVPLLLDILDGLHTNSTMEIEQQCFTLLI
jgi:hypothetical protein